MQMAARSYEANHSLFMRTLFLLLGAIALLALAPHYARAVQYTVGESSGWGLGNDLQQWASQYTFQVGDSLYFPYPTGQHTVLLVTEDDYNNCNIDNPITSDNGLGDMVITLITSETYYFICGIPGHCGQGLRLSILVEPESPTTSPTLPSPDAPPPPDVSHNAPPHDTSPILTPPSPSTPSHSPPYYSPYNTFRRNSAPSPHMNILAYSIIMIVALACML